MSYVTVRLMQRFRRIEAQDAEEEWKGRLAVTCSLLHGLKVALSSTETDV
jgi:hypothetical protein